MKKSLVDYVTHLSNRNHDILTIIIDTKYRKFLKLYWFLKNYSEDISEMKYYETDENVLELDVFIKDGLNDLFKALEKKNKESEKDIIIKKKKSCIHIIVSQEEY